MGSTDIVETTGALKPIDPHREHHTWNITATCEKWHSQEDVDAGHPPYEVIETDGNLLTTAGLARISSLITGGGGQAWNNANSRIGVGDSSTAATIGDTDLNGIAGATHRQFEVMQATFPSFVNGVITWKSQFSSGEANFAWNEWGIDQGTTATTTVVATLLNHKVFSLGTKVSGAVWTLTVTLTLV